MADQDQPDPPKPGLMDGPMLNDVITLYLYGIYVFKRGQLTPAQAMQKVVNLSKMMEKAAAMGKGIQECFAAYGKGKQK